MLAPTILAPDYPLDFQNAVPYKFNEIPDDEIILVDGQERSYFKMSYEYYTDFKSDKAEQFL